jgi:hypothetical protein
LTFRNFLRVIPNLSLAKSTLDMEVFLKAAFISASAFTGLLCGASLDQSIKQLPARRSMGDAAFSAYARAADLKNGVPFYAALGVGAAVTAVVTAIYAWSSGIIADYTQALYLGGMFAICHMVCTTQAAPSYFSQRKAGNELELTRILNRFEKIQTIRSIFMVLNFLAYTWALVLMI